MLQFQLKTLFISTAATAIVCWVLFAPPQWVGAVVIYAVYALIPAVTVAGIVFHRGYWQAFFIGMAPWTAIVVLWAVATQFPFSPFPQGVDLFSSDPDEMVFIKVAYLAPPLVVAAASGLVGTGIRWWAICVQRRVDSQAAH